MEKICKNCRFYSGVGGYCHNIKSPNYMKLVWDGKKTDGFWEPLKKSKVKSAEGVVK